MNRRRHRETAAAGGGGGPTSVNPPTIGEMNQFTKYYRNMLFDYGPERQHIGIREDDIRYHKSAKILVSAITHDDIKIQNDIAKVRGRPKPRTDIYTIPVEISYKDRRKEPWIIAAEYTTTKEMDATNKLQLYGIIKLLTNYGTYRTFRYQIRDDRTTPFSATNTEYDRRSWDKPRMMNITDGKTNIKRLRYPSMSKFIISSPYDDSIRTFADQNITPMSDLIIDYLTNNMLRKKLNEFRKLREDVYRKITHRLYTDYFNIVKKINTQSVANCDRQDRRITELEEVNRTLEDTNEILRNEATTLRERLARLEQKDIIRVNQDPVREVTNVERIPPILSTELKENNNTEGGRKKKHRNKRKTRKNKLSKK